MVNHGDHTENRTGLALNPLLFNPTAHFSPLNSHLESLDPFICSSSQCDNISIISFLCFSPLFVT